MFSGNKKTTIAKSLEMNIEELELFVKRYRGYINAHIKNDTVSNNVILNGLWLIDEVKKESLRERLTRRESISFGSMRNEYIRKYGLEILELRDSGYGAQRISNHLKIAHSVMLSKATIERFIKLNGVHNG
jgi:hypothetical protein